MLGPNVDTIHWSAMTFNTIRLLMECNEAEHPDHRRRLRSQNPIVYTLIHLALDQMINENLAKRFDITFEMSNRLHSHKDRSGMSTEQIDAMSLMGCPLSSSRSKHRSYAAIMGIELTEDMGVLVDDLCDVRDFIYHADTVKIAEGQTPSILQDFFERHGLISPYADDKKHAWFETLVDGNVVGNVFRLFFDNAVPSLQADILDDRCSFRRAVKSGYINSSGYLNTVRKSQIFARDL